MLVAHYTPERGGRCSIGLPKLLGWLLVFSVFHMGCVLSFVSVSATAGPSLFPYLTVVEFPLASEISLSAAFSGTLGTVKIFPVFLFFFVK